MRRRGTCSSPSESAAQLTEARVICARLGLHAPIVEQFETAGEAVCARDRQVAHEQAVEATSLSLSLALGVSLRAAEAWKIDSARWLKPRPTP